MSSGYTITPSSSPSAYAARLSSAGADATTAGFLASFRPLRRPNDTKFRAFAIDVLMINDREITEIMAFTLDTLEHFGLPPTLN